MFFFQAEDGIRDYKVTGVQTCALPIYVQTSYYNLVNAPLAAVMGLLLGLAPLLRWRKHEVPRPAGWLGLAVGGADRKSVGEGKSVDLGGRRIIKKKKKKRECMPITRE